MGSIFNWMYSMKYSNDSQTPEGRSLYRSCGQSEQFDRKQTTRPVPLLLAAVHLTFVSALASVGWVGLGAVTLRVAGAL